MSIFQKCVSFLSFHSSPIEKTMINKNETYRIKNFGSGEYLYATRGRIASELERRIVFTWRAKVKDEELTYGADWLLERSENGNLWRIRNRLYNELLYMADEDYYLDRMRRDVFTSNSSFLSTNANTIRGSLWELFESPPKVYQIVDRNGGFLYPAKDGEGRLTFFGRSVWTYNRKYGISDEDDWSKNSQYWQIEKCEKHFAEDPSRGSSLLWLLGLLTLIPLAAIILYFYLKKR